MENQEAVDLVKKIKDPTAAAKQLAAEAVNRKSKDDISCIVVRFKWVVDFACHLMSLVYILLSCTKYFPAVQFLIWRDDKQVDIHLTSSKFALDSIWKKPVIHLSGYSDILDNNALTSPLWKGCKLYVIFFYLLWYPLKHIITRIYNKPPSILLEVSVYFMVLTNQSSPGIYFSFPNSIYSVHLYS